MQAPKETLNKAVRKATLNKSVRNESRFYKHLN